MTAFNAVQCISWGYWFHAWMLSCHSDSTVLLMSCVILRCIVIHEWLMIIYKQLHEMCSTQDSNIEIFMYPKKLRFFLMLNFKSVLPSATMYDNIIHYISVRVFVVELSRSFTHCMVSEEARVWLYWCVILIILPS